MTTAGPFGMVPTRAVWDRRVTPGLLRVLAGLAVHANHNRVVTAGQALLAAELGVSQPAISQAIGKLVTLGFVESVRLGFPARNRYRILFDQPPIAPTRPHNRTRADRPDSPVISSEVVTDGSNPSDVPVITSELMPVISSEVMSVPISEQRDRTDTLAPAVREGGSQEPGDADPAAPFAGYEWLPRHPLYVRAVTLMPAPNTRREVGRWAKAISELRDCRITPDQLTRAVRAYRAQWPRARVTITGLSANWSLLGGTPDGIHERSPEEESAQAAADEAASLARRDAKAGLVDLFRVG